VYWSHLSKEAKSVGESFQRLSGSVSRMANRFRCSRWETENHNFVKQIPELTSIRSRSGVSRINSKYCWGVQNPITRSTPALLYQDLSIITISPPEGRC